MIVMSDEDAVWHVTAKLGAGLGRAEMHDLLEDAGLEVLDIDGTAQPRARIRARDHEIRSLATDHGRSVWVVRDPSGAAAGPDAGAWAKAPDEA